MRERIKEKKKEIIRQEEIERKSTKRKMIPNSRLIGDYDRIKEKEIEESEKKKKKRVSDAEFKNVKKREIRERDGTSLRPVKVKQP